MTKKRNKILFCAGLSLLITSIMAELALVVLKMIARHSLQYPSGNFGEKKFYYSQVMKSTQHTPGHTEK